MQKKNMVKNFVLKKLKKVVLKKQFFKLIFRSNFLHQSFTRRFFDFYTTFFRLLHQFFQLFFQISIIFGVIKKQQFVVDKIKETRVHLDFRE